MNTVLVTNLTTYLLMLLLLTALPLLPGMIIRRFLANGLAADRAQRRPTRR